MYFRLSIAVIALIVGVIIDIHDKSLTKWEKAIGLLGLFLILMSLIVITFTHSAVIGFIADLFGVMTAVVLGMYLNHQVQHRSEP